MFRKFKFSVLTVIITVGAATAQTRVTTIPEVTVLKDSLKNEVGKAPFDVTALQPEMVYNISTKGYEAISLKFAKSKSGITFPEGLADCAPCLMELNGSPMDVGVEKTGKLRLRKKIVEHRQTIMIGVMEPKVDIPAETVVAMINGKKIKISNNDIHLTMGYTQNLTHPLVNGLGNSFLDAYDNVERKKDNTRLYVAKVLVKPVIKSLAYRLDGKLMRDYTGPARIECEWQFFYSSDTTKNIGSIRTVTALYRTSQDYNLPVHLLIYEAARDLSANDTLFTYLDKLEKDYMSNAVSVATSITRVPESNYATQQEMIKKVSLAVVTIENEEGFGSGVIIDPSGIILTNHHVIITDTTSLMVRVAGFDELIPAKVKVLNSDYDLALIELPPGKYPAISLYTKAPLEVGDVVYTIGTPLDKMLDQSVTKGIASGFRKLNGVNFIQTDVSINSGNSGGALINESGRLMGIATLKATGKGIEGLGFCISAGTAETALRLGYK